MGDAERQAGELQWGALVDRDDLLGLLPRGGLAERLLEHAAKLRAELGVRIDEAVAVFLVDVRRDRAAAHRRHGEGVVEMAVREQYRGRLEVEFGEHMLELVGDADARVDDHTLGAALTRDDVAVRAHRGSREGNGQHPPKPTGRGHSAFARTSVP